jgi:hypothetical protein
MLTVASGVFIVAERAIMDGRNRYEKDVGKSFGKQQAYVQPCFFQSIGDFIS